MNFDFSSLENLTKQGKAKEGKEEQQEKGKTDEIKEIKEIEEMEEMEEIEEEPLGQKEEESFPKLQRLAHQTSKREEQILEIYQRYQENIKKTEGIKSKLLKGLEEEMDFYLLLEIAMEGIGAMTNDSIFLKQGKEKMEERSEHFVEEYMEGYTLLEEVKQTLESLEQKEEVEKLSQVQDKWMNRW